jgi:RNA polymerase sigma factor (TIGR02999 family)
MHESITQVLESLSAGEPEAAERLWPLIYEELRPLARRCLRGQARSPILDTTSLVHEAFLKLVDANSINWQGRTHFLAVVARAIRRVAVDWARSERTAKRGGGRELVALHDQIPGRSTDQIDVLVLDETLERLSGQHTRCGTIVELRFFVGLTVVEIAQVLGVTRRTIDDDWQFARSWLNRELSQRDER